jgi:hypothetical protein
VWTGYQPDGGGDLPRFTFVKAIRLAFRSSVVGLDTG